MPKSNKATKVAKIETARELKAARQSVRAKIRKALAVEGAELTKTDIAALNRVMSNLDAKIAPKKAVTETAETADAADEAVAA
jgi:hypothetical protein